MGVKGNDGWIRWRKRKSERIFNDLPAEFREGSLHCSAATRFPICSQTRDNHGFAESAKPWSHVGYAFAAVHGVLREDGRLSGGADPQRDGMALLV